MGGGLEKKRVVLQDCAPPSVKEQARPGTADTGKRCGMQKSRARPSPPWCTAETKEAVMEKYTPGLQGRIGKAVKRGGRRSAAQVLNGMGNPA